MWEGWGGAADHTIIERCSITDNGEGGLMFEGSANATIHDCVLRNNSRYGLYLSGNHFDIQNVVIDSCVAQGFALQSIPSRQCALKIAQESAIPSIFRNLTIRNCDMRNLFSGTYPTDPESVFENFLMVDNTYDHLQTYWNDPSLDQPIRFVNCYMPETPPVGEGTVVGLTPQFDDEIGFPWLSPTSPCIDMGTSDPLTNDQEDPDTPGFALWPSQG
ncbi:MAG: right-handed parallel beta-helix repeat-containing protein, partial [Calditrichaeota bacterium]|nr:right-handed parallel beta-helix repeat-containing protein [Calditrichota bacterium]